MKFCTEYIDNNNYPKITIHETLEDAIEFAEKMELPIIYELGGNYATFEKCWFCGEWYESNELNKDGVCHRCDIAIKDHNGGW